MKLDKQKAGCQKTLRLSKNSPSTSSAQIADIITDSLRWIAPLTGVMGHSTPMQLVPTFPLDADEHSVLANARLVLMFPYCAWLMLEPQQTGLLIRHVCPFHVYLYRFWARLCSGREEMKTLTGCVKMEAYPRLGRSATARSAISCR